MILNKTPKLNILTLIHNSENMVTISFFINKFKYFEAILPKKVKYRCKVAMVTTSARKIRLLHLK